ncbi:modifier of snc1 [Striga asiatica]|uniref:Modifier of snc1 n=1 Tax=Striga asiatica TaxID=4170 RepID=A0A5A7R6Q3_STRAF|nr:modifier of snc1 [Striga asiatica]
MNSSMLAGERRWASARRGGMTVLGKVAVPKPLNLPSQKLENHGLDPNVEIVPKGTLSWGSRPSSSGSNPWISSSVSPNAEGGTVSPSHLSGRPSSGGSGTRPSTAGSERSHEPASSAWGSSSRPSSASGTFSLNQTSSTSLRPKSAENRPNSSQLSRFADPVSKNSAAWGPSGTAERLGVRSSKDEDFTLSSGDFPTLGSEKNNSLKNAELEELGRPRSASGRIAHGKADSRSQTDSKHGAVDTWRADGFQGVDDDIHPCMEKWNGDNPPQYFNPNTAPQHFDTWRGPAPMNGQAGIAPPPLAGSQPGPTPGPRGPHPKNGDLYRPQMPDAYAHPGIPFRPGFYPGPPGPRGPPGPPAPMAFEGYYGPRMGCEPDIPYMGMAAGPPVYNSSYPGTAPGIGNSHGRNGHGQHPGKTSSEHVGADLAEDTQGPKRIHLKSHINQRDHPRDERKTWEHNPQPDVSYPDRHRPHMMSSRKNEWGAEEDTEESVHAKRRMPSQMTSRSSDYKVHSSDGVKVKSFEGTSNPQAVYDKSTNASESAPSLQEEMPRVILGSEKDSSLRTGLKNPSLMHKIDGLNAKIRVSDGRNISPRAHNREEERNRSQVIDAKVNSNVGEGTHAGSFESTPRDFTSGPHEMINSASDKPLQQVTVMSRRPHHGGQGRIDHRGKGKFGNVDSDGWRKKPLTTELSHVITASHDESKAHGTNVKEASEDTVSKPVGKIEEEALVDTLDSSDIQAQRAKMREIAKQRVLQLQKEEEERIKEQRAKALAKLEELNRRTLTVETGTEKLDKGQVINDNLEEQDESRVVSEPVMASINSSNQAEESMIETSTTLPVETIVTSLSVHEDARDVSAKKTAPQFNDGVTSRHKRTSYKQKQNSSLQKSFTERPVSDVAANSKALGDNTYVATNDIKPHEYTSSEIKSSEANVLNAADTVAEPSVPHRRKNNRSGKSKHKLDGTPLPPVEADIDPGKESVEKVVTGKDSVDKIVTTGSLSNSDTSVLKSIETYEAVEARVGFSSSLLNEESHSRVSSQWRPHSSRRQPRSQQQANNKSHGGDAVWAPVGTQNKANKGSIEASPNSVHELANLTKGNSHSVQNSLKGKRAEMERYVPKPVAKELSQQGNVQNLSSFTDSSQSKDGWSGEVNEVNVARNKHKKDHGTWKQLGPTDSSHMKGGHIGPSSTFNPVKEIQEAKEIGQSVKGETDTVNAEIRTCGTGRGKRNVSRATGYNTQPEKTFGGEEQTDRSTTGSKENRASSHWQPKPSSNAAINNQSEINRSSKKEQQHYQPKGQGGSSSQTQPGQPPAGNEEVHVESNVGFGSRRNGKHNNNRSVRGHDNNNARGDWNSGHDNRTHPFWDNRQRNNNNTHYEYQAVGQLKGNNNRLEKVDEPVEGGADSNYQKQRERGSGHPRRGGNYNRRQTGAPAHVDSNWE